MRRLLLTLVLCGACQFGVEVPVAARVTCDQTDCPSGRFCIDRVCVPASECLNIDGDSAAPRANGTVCEEDQDVPRVCIDGACVESACGDGVFDARAEACEGEDNCVAATCQRPRCQDGIVQASLGEECDDEALFESGQCVRETCLAAGCGDGIVQSFLGEECDDGEDNADERFCTLACRENFCGDGKHHEGVEACDDGNELNTDNCLVASGCVLNVCGDGFVNSAGEEQCDDGNLSSFDGCSPNCDNVAWQRALNANVPREGAVLAASGLGASISIDPDVLPIFPEVLALRTGTQTVSLLAIQDGRTLWTQTFPAPLAGPMTFDGEYFVFGDELGRVRGIPLSTPETFQMDDACRAAQPVSGAPNAAVAWCAEVGEPLLIGPTVALELVPFPGAVNFSAADSFAVDVQGNLHRISPPKGLDLGDPITPRADLAVSLVDVVPLADIAGVPPHARALTFAGGLGLMFPSAQGLWIYRGACPTTSSTLNVGASTDLAFIGNRVLEDSVGDLAFVRGADSTVFRTQVPDASPEDNCENPALVPNPTTIIDFDTVVPPLLLPIAGTFVVGARANGDIIRSVGPTFPSTRVLYSNGAPFDIQGFALDGEGFVYGLDINGLVHRVHVVTGAQQIVADLKVITGVASADALDAVLGGSGSGRLAVAPFVAGRGVFLVGKSGFVIALEGGGSDVPLGGAWSRSSGNNYGVAAASCSTQPDLTPFAALALVLLLVNLRARRTSQPDHVDSAPLPARPPARAHALVVDERTPASPGRRAAGAQAQSREPQR